MRAVVTIRDFGPVGYANVEIKPLTVFIGRNSAGKSTLLYLLWTLFSTEPTIGGDLHNLRWDLVAREEETLRERIRLGAVSGDDIKRFAELVFEEVFKEVVRRNLERRLKYVFGVNHLKELVRVGASHSSIEVEGSCGRLSLSIRETIAVETLDICLSERLQKIAVERGIDGKIYIKYQAGGFLDEKSKPVVEEVTTDRSLVAPFFKFFSESMFEEFGMFHFAASLLSSLLPDSRAGIARTLLKPYFPTLQLPGILGVDRDYVSLYFMLTERLSKAPDSITSADFLFEELGAVPEVKFESGAYVVYFRTWTGKTLPLPQAPSGLREVVTVVLSLLLPLPRVVFIEEPEAHLHPRAQRLMARVIAEAVNRGKYVVLTTHSDYLISEFSNLISLSAFEKPPGRLGYRDVEALRPEMVAAYLFKAEGNRAVVEKLEVDKTGIPEDEFARVAEEILEIRNELY